MCKYLAIVAWVSVDIKELIVKHEIVQRPGIEVSASLWVSPQRLRPETEDPRMICTSNGCTVIGVLDVRQPEGSLYIFGCFDALFFPFYTPFIHLKRDRYAYLE